jgi:hypothetical protein
MFHDMNANMASSDLLSDAQRIWEFEVNYCDFVCVAYILDVGMLENFELHLVYKFGRASSTHNNRKAVSCYMP